MQASGDCEGQLQIRHRSLPLFSPFQELVTFAKYVLNRFFAVAAKNNKAYIELLFWKNVGAAREMTEGYTKDGFVLFVFNWWYTMKYVFRWLMLTGKSYREKNKHWFKFVLHYNLIKKWHLQYMYYISKLSCAIWKITSIYSWYGREGKKPTWTEEEEEELRKLFEEHRHSGGLFCLFAHLFGLLSYK